MLKVAKGAGGEGMSVSRGVEKEDVKQLGNDIRFIKTNIPEFTHKQSALFGSTIFWVLLIIPLILYLLFLIWFRKYKKNYADELGTKKRKANSTAQKQLKLANEFLQKNEYNAFFDEVFKALYGYIGNKLILSASELNKEKIKLELASKSIDHNTIIQLIELLETCEFARFAPVKNEEKMKEAYNNSVELISLLENKLNK
jgi:Ca2+/Na+ antiporter